MKIYQRIVLFLICVAVLALPFSCFASNERKYGDVNADGIVNSVDALNILQYSVGENTFTSQQINFADVNCDLFVNSEDALEVLMYSTGVNDNVFANTLLKKTKVDSVLSTGKYTITGTDISDDESGSTPVTMAVDGDNFAIKTQYSDNGISYNVKIIKLSGKYYFVISKKILAGEMSLYDDISEEKVDALSASLNKFFSVSSSYGGTKSIIENNISYTVESYMSEDKAISEYYFNPSGEWKKIVTTASDSTVSVTEISSITPTVDSSIFTLGTKADLLDYLN